MKKGFFSRSNLVRVISVFALLIAVAIVGTTELKAQSSLDPAAIPSYQDRIGYYTVLQQQYLPATGKFDYIKAEIQRLQAYIDAINTGNLSYVKPYEDNYLEFSESFLEEFTQTDVNLFQNEVEELESDGRTSSRYYAKLKKIVYINSY